MQKRQIINDKMNVLGITETPKSQNEQLLQESNASAKLLIYKVCYAAVANNFRN